MKVLYIDCGMGAAGDMLLGALLELHPEPEAFLARLNAALPARVRVSAGAEQRRSIRTTRVHVRVDGREEGEDAAHETQHSCGSGALLERIDALSAPQAVRERTRRVYARILRAESQVHGRPVEEVHLHELGSLDALADVLGVCWLLEELAPDRVLASPVHVGGGQVRCAHGLLPVPAPATELLLRGIPWYTGEIRTELCTPTGAALLAETVEHFGPMPTLRVERCGYGLGSKELEALNALRVLWGEADTQPEQVLELRCNLDDCDGETLGFACEELLRLGALDVYTSPIGMKKGRPGVLLTCLCREAQRERMLACLFRHTATLGVREYRCPRYTLRRSLYRAETPWGPVTVKRAEGWGVCREKVEYEDLAAIARAQDLSLREVRERVEKSEGDL